MPKRPHEVLVVVRRGDEVLVAHRAPGHGGFWHAISGGLEEGESDAEAATRELLEETGLVAAAGALLHTYSYPLADEPERLGDFLPGTESISVSCFLVDAPPDWEPRLDHEHDDYRWCDVDEARSLMRFADAADAVARLAGDYA